MRIVKKTRRSHVASARITEVRSIGGEGNVEQSAASVNCAVSICEVTDKPEQLSHNNDALFHTHQR